MARRRRIKRVRREGWYHVYCKAAGGKGEFPLAKSLCQRKLVGLLRFYARVYCCEISAFSIMGNHYHLVIKFEAPRKLSRGELLRRARVLYPNSGDLLRCWPAAKWKVFENRLFDLSRYMHNVQTTFATWFNRQHQRHGRFWGDRFKSTILQDLAAVRDCMLYVDLNPVRAGIVQRPEQYRWCSYYLRVIDKADWLKPLEEFETYKSAGQALRDYRGRLYYRGRVPTKKGQAAISQAIVEHEKALGFKTPGMYRERLRYFVDGVVLGSEEFVRDYLVKLKKEGYYLRRKNPIPQLAGVHATLREQRSHAAAW
ncbi:MAG: hypothetical protein K9M57_05845 [Phycisphaerae bacterium]|nr:hypothetical protein [Phycisphaerae bacterium]